MSTILGLTAEAPATAEPPRVIPIREQRPPKPAAASLSLHDEQIHALVRQLFFSHESALVRHAGFAAADASTDAATLCLGVARALAAEGAYDVGLIDAGLDSASLPSRLNIPSPARVEGSWLIAPRLWMVPRRCWLAEGCGQKITQQRLAQLRALTEDFDFSILSCPPASSLGASIAQACDGLVLVLTANKTRRLVAAQIKQQLDRSQIALLGTVLVERRFPVPQGLYRSL